jgi:hypothetical protein
LRNSLSRNKSSTIKNRQRKEDGFFEATPLLVIFVSGIFDFSGIFGTSIR